MGSNEMNFIGQSILRKEDVRFLTGVGQYTDDVNPPHHTHAYFLRSPHAHAKIGKIDVSKAKSAPGVIAIYTGREDNILWRRLPGEDGGRIEAAGAKSLSERDALPLGHDIIHSVTNPIGRLTGAIHVYGGDFFGVSRKEWDPERLVEQPYDVQKTMQLFEESNRLYAARS